MFFFQLALILLLRFYSSSCSWFLLTLIIIGHPFLFKERFFKCNSCNAKFFQMCVHQQNFSSIGHSHSVCSIAFEQKDRALYTKYPVVTYQRPKCHFEFASMIDSSSALQWSSVLICRLCALIILVAHKPIQFNSILQLLSEHWTHFSLCVLSLLDRD